MLRELYFGKVIPWERHSPKSAEHLSLLRKIEEEKQYFMAQIAQDDRQRFQALSDMHGALTLSEEGELFSFGFTMGAMLMMDVHKEAEAMNVP